MARTYRTVQTNPAKGTIKIERVREIVLAVKGQSVRSGTLAAKPAPAPKRNGNGHR